MDDHSRPSARERPNTAPLFGRAILDSAAEIRHGRAGMRRAVRRETMHCFTSARLGLASLALALSGCWYSGNVDANGANRNLTFAIAGGGVVGTHLPFDLVVVRYPNQWQNICTSPSATGVHIQGGDPCNVIGNSTLKTTPIALTKASCNGGGCDVTTDPNLPATPAGSLTLRVTPKGRGSTTLSLSVRATDGSGSWDDSYTFPVDDIARLGFTHLLPDDAPSSLGVMPGIPVAWTPQALASDGTLLAATADAFKVSWAGASVGPGPDGTLRTLAAGTSTATIQAAGTTGTASVRVVDPSDAQAIAIERAFGYTVGESNWVLVETSPAKGYPLTEIDLGADYRTGPFVLVLTMADGTRALGAVSMLTTTNTAVSVEPESASIDGWTFWVDARDPSETGGANLTAQIGHGSLAIPIHPFPGYGDTDAGTDADASGEDAGADSGAADSGAADGGAADSARD
jgi:hypothetical protein